QRAAADKAAMRVPSRRGTRPRSLREHNALVAVPADADHFADTRYGPRPVGKLLRQQHRSAFDRDEVAEHAATEHGIRDGSGRDVPRRRAVPKKAQRFGPEDELDGLPAGKPLRGVHMNRETAGDAHRTRLDRLTGEDVR